MINRSIQAIYRSPRFNGYGKECAYKRFSFLKALSFESVLDVGSGACLLKGWLSENSIAAHYEAVDIRPDALALCNCTTHERIPTGELYDLVCLFGTVTYNIDGDEQKNKLVLLNLLQHSIKVCQSYLLFTVFKEKVREKYKDSISEHFFVYFSKEEIEKMLKNINITKFEIIENDELDTQEYFVLCTLTKNKNHL